MNNNTSDNLQTFELRVHVCLCNGFFETKSLSL